LALFHELVRNLFSNELMGFVISKADFWLIDCLGSIIFVIAMALIDMFFFERHDDESNENDNLVE